MKFVTHNSVFSLTTRKCIHIVSHKLLAIVEEQLLLLCCPFIELFPLLDQISFLVNKLEQSISNGKLKYAYVNQLVQQVP